MRSGAKCVLDLLDPQTQAGPGHSEQTDFVPMFWAYASWGPQTTNRLSNGAPQTKRDTIAVVKAGNIFWHGHLVESQN